MMAGQGMASDDAPGSFDDNNPEWTEADFARARPIAEFRRWRRRLQTAASYRSHPSSCLNGFENPSGRQSRLPSYGPRPASADSHND